MGVFGRALIALSVGVALSCGSDKPSTALLPGEVGPAGGVVESNGVVITVPPGALDHAVAIVVTPDAPAPAGLLVEGSAYRFEPAGLHFATPIT